MKDFTLKKYLDILQALRNKDIPIYGVEEWLRIKPEAGALIRHDVDRRPKNALQMARAEAAMGIFTTYYFRIVGSAYNPEIISAISSLGHEVGYHYEDLSLARGDPLRAKNFFGNHLEMLREVAPIVTVAMHGSPLSPYNNIDIWQSISLAEYGLIGEAFLTVDYSGTYYFTDTGRGWNSTTTNLRDRPLLSLYANLDGAETNSLLDFIIRADIKKVAFSIHPERWDSSVAGWFSQMGRDFIFNSIKRLIAFIR
jgi:hypothetical protein